MFLFIVTIFIAELIITLTVISYIVRADNAVLKCQKDLIALKPQIKAALLGVREGVHLVKEKQVWLFEFIEQKRNLYMVNAIKTVLIYLLLFIVKCRFKRAAKVCQWVLLVKDLLEGISA